MIPLYKLEKLPRSQGLRKIIKILAAAETALIQPQASSPYQPGISVPSVSRLPDLSYLDGILAFLCRDTVFSPAATTAIREARRFMQELTEYTPLSSPKNRCGSENDAILRRALNTVRHILLTETGTQTADWDFIDFSGRLDPLKRTIFPGMTIYLEDIRSPFNVGAMFRTAESFGVDRIFLSPLCADPNHPRARRTAMGCVDILPWERLPEGTGETPILFPPLLTQRPLFALETGGVAIARFNFPSQAVMIVGSEELGVGSEALAAADASLGRLSIPTYGAKGSLNAAVAFGIALQAWAAVLTKGNP
jgi:TrmH family RNA methyltransferase